MNWAPFLITSERPEAPRAISTRDGVGDRLRTAAFAELQAREAFNWAADFFTDAPDDLRQAWRMLARAEEKHLNWLLARMETLGIRVDERPVSEQLWISLRSCKTACEFAVYMATAEDRGRQAGERFAIAMKKEDPESAEIFGKIAEEEVSHIELSRKFFPIETLARGLH